MKLFISYACWLFISVTVLSCKNNKKNTSATTNKTDDGAVAQEELIDPLVIESKDGVLRYKLTAKLDEISVGEKTFVSNVYNGSYAVPVLVVQQGDSINLEFDNQIDKGFNIDGPQDSNLHYHGMGVTPKEPGDNPYVHIRSKKYDNTQMHYEMPGGIYHKSNI